LFDDWNDWTGREQFDGSSERANCYLLEKIITCPLGCPVCPLGMAKTR
jgi:hypothetical protein